MPLFEYQCKACDRRFEAIVFGTRKPSCPDCGGRRLTRQISVFAVNTRGGSPARGKGPSSCGTCGDPRGPGACSRD